MARLTELSPSSSLKDTYKGLPIGKVDSDMLTVKTAAGEFSAPLTELHDAWWNSIARALA